MRESRTFGSVRGEGSDVLAYSETSPEHAVVPRVPSAVIRAKATATKSGGEACRDPQQSGRGGSAGAQDAVGRLDQLSDLGGAVVSRDFLPLVPEEVLAVFQTDSRGP
jgi:hypothetical protein